METHGVGEGYALISAKNQRKVVDLILARNNEAVVDLISHPNKTEVGDLTNLRQIEPCVGGIGNRVAHSFRKTRTPWDVCATYWCVLFRLSLQTCAPQMERRCLAARADTKSLAP